MFVYHEVTDSPSEFQRLTHGFTTPAELERQLRWIGERFVFVAPTDLPQLGGRRALPGNAALVTFDDAWAGAFRTGLPILQSLGVPAICFVNMATVAGTPDLSAVRRYERLNNERHHSRLDSELDADAAARLIGEIQRAYGSDPEFLRFQGATASTEDLLRIGRNGAPVWLGSHLFHHWDPETIDAELLRQSARENLDALAAYSSALPALATPYGRAIEWSPARAQELSAAVLFVATGGQNRSPSSPVLDRLELEPAPSEPRDWWWSVHRRRLFGKLAI